MHEVNTPEYEDNGLYQAIDLGVSKIVTAVNTQGKFLEVKNQRQDKYWTPKNQVKSRRDHCKNKSRKWKKLNNLVRKTSKKMSDQAKDFQHKLSNKIVNNTKWMGWIGLVSMVFRVVHSQKRFRWGINREAPAFR